MEKNKNNETLKIYKNTLKILIILLIKIFNYNLEMRYELSPKKSFEHTRKLKG